MTRKQDLHVLIDERVHDRLFTYLLNEGRGKVRRGRTGGVVSEAIAQFIDTHPVILTPGSK